MAAVLLLFEVYGDLEKSGDDLGTRSRMLRRLHGRKAAPAGQCHRQEKLVAEIRPGKGLRRKISGHAPGRLVAHGLRRHAELSKAADDFGAKLELHLEDQDVPRSDIVRQLVDAAGLAGPAKYPFDRRTYNLQPTRSGA